jgi:hypothetical protein
MTKINLRPLRYTGALPARTYHPVRAGNQLLVPLASGKLRPHVLFIFKPNYTPSPTKNSPPASGGSGGGLGWGKIIPPNNKTKQLFEPF